MLSVVFFYHFMFLVSDPVIFRLATILANDAMAVEKRDQIHGQLGLSHVSQQALWIKYPANFFGFFKNTLHEFKGMNLNATVKNVVKHLKELQMQSAIGKLAVS